MKKFIFISFVFTSSIIASLYGHPQVKTSHQYNQRIENKTLERFSANGNIILNNASIKSGVFVNGTLSAAQSTIGSLDVNGEAKIENSLISGETKINGSLKAEQTKFQGILSISSEKTVLKNCETSTIFVKKIGNTPTQQTIELSGKTVIKGDIVFETKGGVVKVTNEVTLLGEIIGGVVQNQGI